MGVKRALRAGLLAPLCVLTVVVALSADASRPSYRLTPAPHRHPPMILHHMRDGTASSLNWSGYAVTGASGSVTDVKGSWTVPAIQGACPGTNEYASFWVGIDGFNSNTVEQIGTDSDCQNGVPTYYAWFEFYPHPAFLINGLAISPGNVISAEVSYNASNRWFTVSLTNVTTGQSFSTSTKVNRAQRSSAEWIAEAPSGSGGILPLADFGTVVYGMDNTGVAGTSYTTVQGMMGPIGSFATNVVIDMVTSGGATKAAPSPLSSDGSSFSDSWYSSGP